MEEFDHRSPEERHDALYELILAELVVLRRHKPGAFYVSDLWETPTILQSLGAGSPSDAYSALKEIADTQRFNNRDVQAAYTTLFWSVGNPDEGIDERLKQAGQDLAVDPRNARPYSDRGLEILAHWIVRDATRTHPLASPQYEVRVLPVIDGRVRLRIEAHGAKNGGIGRPNWIEVDHHRISFGDAEIVDDGPSLMTLRWEISTKIPRSNGTLSGKEALEICVAFNAIALAKLSFSEDFDHKDFRIRFTSQRNMAYVQLIRR